MACWDLCGKALGVPVWHLLGGSTVIRLEYNADTPEDRDPKVELGKIKKRVLGEGYTWLKMALEYTR